MELKLDSIDEKIVDMLQKNARTSIKEIAQNVYLSSPAVTARIERLEKNGIITGYHAQVDPHNFGYKIKAFVSLDLEPSRKEQFYPFIESQPNVTECNCITGDYSMLIQVKFAETTELDDFVNMIQRYGKTKTQIVFSTPVEHRAVSLTA